MAILTSAQVAYLKTVERDDDRHIIAAAFRLRNALAPSPLQNVNEARDFFVAACDKAAG